MQLAPVQQTRLREALALLEQANSIVQDALGEVEATMLICNGIQDAIEDIENILT